ncbi:arad-like aldolase/epimerase [Suillus hirtellus]|nr:arad-like aldolase/epimerase [Suillus hirtellus]
MAAPLKDASKLDIWMSTIPAPPTFSDPLEYRAFLKFRLAQAYRIFGKYGFDEGVAGHITVRAFSALGVPLDPLTQDSCAFYKDHSLYSEFRGIVDDREEGVAIANALGSNKAVILKNHGILVATKSIESTVFYFISMEKCCKVQTVVDQAAAARGLKPHLIDPVEATDTWERVGSEAAGWFNGFVEFQLLEHEEGKKFEYVPAP